MKNFIKNAGLTFFINVLTFILSLIGLIFMLVANGHQGYGLDNVLVIVAQIATLVIIAALTVLSLKFGAQNPFTVALKLFAILFISYSFSVIISSRVLLISALFSWDSHNELGWSVFYDSIVSVVCYLFAVISIIVGGFLGGKKRAKTDDSQIYSDASAE